MLQLFKRKVEEICVVKSDFSSPLGINGEMTAAMVIAENKRLLPHELLTDSEDKPLRCSYATYIETENRVERMKELFIPQLTEILLPLKKYGKKVKLFTGLPEKSDFFTSEDVSELTNAISETLKENAVTAEVNIFCKGHSSGLICLEKAISVLRKEKADFCIVGGIDSYIDDNHLYHLLQSGRLYSSDVKHGFIPGEGAGFVLLTTRTIADKCELPVYAKVKSVAGSMEEERALEGKRCLAKGISKAVSLALDKIDTIDKIYCDLNGEKFRVEEYNFLISRFSQILTNPGSFVSSCRNYGDVGAATFPSLLNLAIHLNSEPVTGIYLTSSDSGLRSAAVIETEPQKEK